MNLNFQDNIFHSRQQTLTMTHQLILCTCPDPDSAQTIAEALIGQNLAACVNILPGLTSVYRWRDNIETAQEQLLLIKTRQDRYHELEAAIRQNHPYELPEIIAVPVERGLPKYLQWIDECVTSK